MLENIFEISCEGLSTGSTPEPCIVVIFGASGDLAQRELLPALYSLYYNGLMPKEFAVIGSARSDWSDEQFREKMHHAVKKEAEFNEKAWNRFAKRLFYCSGDISDSATGFYAGLTEKIKQVRQEHDIPDNLLFHLSVAPRFYGTIVKKLDEADYFNDESGSRRIIFEKPFGEDEQSARELDQQLRSVLSEDEIYRVDHFLGKETVQNMLVFRFANPEFEPIWNRNYIDHVQITVAEDIGIGSRAGFYEKTGVVRDMIQNHLLQLLCMTAIEPPVRYDAESLRSETVKVLDAIRPLDVENDVVLGQYGKGKINGKEVTAYRDEKDVDDNSMTTTYAALKLQIDNWRWAGVPFYLRTGKRMKEKISEITISFKPTPHLMFSHDENEKLQGNTLTFRLQPNEAILRSFFAKQPGAEICLQPVRMNFRYHTAFGIKEMPGAYEWLLHDAMEGDQTLFPRADWIYKAWSIIDPIIEKWQAEPWTDVPNYAAGDWGPEAADELLQRNGHAWHVV